MNCELTPKFNGRSPRCSRRHCQVFGRSYRPLRSSIKSSNFPSLCSPHPLFPIMNPRYVLNSAPSTITRTSILKMDVDRRTINFSRGSQRPSTTSQSPTIYRCVRICDTVAKSLTSCRSPFKSGSCTEYIDVEAMFHLVDPSSTMDASACRYGPVSDIPTPSRSTFPMDPVLQRMSEHLIPSALPCHGPVSSLTATPQDVPPTLLDGVVPTATGFDQFSGSSNYLQIHGEYINSSVPQRGAAIESTCAPQDAAQRGKHIQRLGAEQSPISQSPHARTLITQRPA